LSLPRKIPDLELFENSTPKGRLKHEFCTLSTKIVCIIRGEKIKIKMVFFVVKWCKYWDMDGDRDWDWDRDRYRNGDWDWENDTRVISDRDEFNTILGISDIAWHTFVF